MLSRNGQGRTGSASAMAVAMRSAVPQMRQWGMGEACARPFPFSGRDSLRSRQG